MNRQITIDADGIILLFKRDEQGSYGIARNFKDKLQRAFEKASGSQYQVKLAYEDELEDKLIDFWSLKPKETADNADTQETEAVDPLENLTRNFGEIIENTDDSEFVGYNSQEDNFSQSSFDDDDREEFLEENELSDDNE